MNILIIILLIINLIISIVIFILQLPINRKIAFICLFTSAFIPIFGPLMCAAMLIQFQEGRHEMAADETIKKYAIKETEYVDQERLRNVVPTNDALSISNESERRTFLLGLLRKKDLKSLNNTLKKALTNEDSEASHYAASAIMELQRESYSVMMENEKIYKQSSPASYEDSIAYAVSIMGYLDCSEVGQLENYTFRSRYETTMKYIIDNHLDSCNPTDFENLIDMLIKQGRNEEASIYSKKYCKQFPDVENSLVYRLQTAYLQNDETEFQETIKNIHNSDFVLSPSTLSMIRFWKTNQETSKKDEI